MDGWIMDNRIGGWMDGWRIKLVDGWITELVDG